ncbi:MAG: rhomboid family intramembrane serine protease [Planctomycetes bacterium]|nr:rhomboid family intramembrane serine protease [Planctomycetota bacterium]MCB9884308.1 rhomboid family intramembrane serine protease [Planctomycetota bacterium]
MFVCPKCQGVLRRKRLPDRPGNSWQCRACGGQALTMALLRQMLVAPGPDELWGKALRGTDDPACKCPSCRGVMRSVDHEIAGDVVRVEVCKRCQMVWFDAHELGFFPAVQPPPEDPVPLEVRQQLALAHVARQVDQVREEDPGLGSLRRWPALVGLPVEIDGAVMSTRHVATWITAGSIAVVSVLGLLRPEVVTALQLRPMSDFGATALLTSFFVHAGVLQLLLNLWFLIVFANDVEDMLGTARWWVMLIAATIFGNVLQLAAGVVLDDPHPYIGAGGGVTAFVLYYTLRMPDARLGSWDIPGLHPSLGMGYPSWDVMSAKGWFVAWVVLQALLTYAMGIGSPIIVATAHLGGATVGLLFHLATRDR